MKRLLFLFAICFVFISLSQGQNRTCAPPDSLANPGFEPSNGSLDCFVQNVSASRVINFKNFEQVTFQGQTVTVDYIEFNSIENLPCGLTWSTNKSNSPNPDRFQENEVGCIEISGATDDSVGQYRLKFNVTAKVQEISIEIDTVVRALGIRYDLQVKANQGDNCPALDTNKAGQTACDGSNVTNITDQSALQDLSIAPNPFTGSTKIELVSHEAGTYKMQVHSLLGEQLREKSISVSSGYNNIPFKQKDLSKGIYVVHLSNGQQSLTRKLVIDNQ